MDANEISVWQNLEEYFSLLFYVYQKSWLHWLGSVVWSLLLYVGVEKAFLKWKEKHGASSHALWRWLKGGMWKSLADNRLSVTIVVVTFLGMLAISFLMFCEVNKKFHMANNLLPSVQQLRLSFASREAEMRAQYEIRIKDLEGSYAFLQEELNQKKSLAQNQDSPEEIVRKASVKDQFFQLNGKQYQQVIEFLGHIKGDVKPNGQPDHLLSVIGGHPTYNWTHPARTAAAQELQRKMDQINEKLDTDVSIDTFMERVPNDEIKDQFRKFYKVWTDVKNGVHGWNREDAQKEHKYDWENDSIPDFEQMRVAVDNLSEPALNMQRMMEAYKNAPY